MAQESELLRRIAERSAGLTRRHGHVLVGPGDDCAVVRVGAPASAHPLLVLSVDQLVEGRHFTPHTPTDFIARKAIARAVSDLAAMAARPCWSLAAGVLVSEDPRADALCERLAHWGEYFGVPIVGGDLATFGQSIPASPSTPMVLSITVAGEIDPSAGERPILRSGAQPGDGLYVTGRIGNSFASGRHLSFVPRIPEAIQLRRTLGDRLHAMIDVSDGVGRDASRLADSSRLTVLIESALVPLHADAAHADTETDINVRNAIADGEDYELLFAASGDVPSELHVDSSPSADAPTPCATPITRIGRFEPGNAGRCDLELATGQRIDARSLGWDHR